MKSRITIWLLLALCALPALGQPSDSVLQSLKDELTRSMTSLKSQAEPPYYLAYELTDNHAYNLRAEYGVVIQSNQSRTRHLDIDLRVGDPKLDNTHPLRERGMGVDMSEFLTKPIPIEDDPMALRTAIWAETDRKYKEAVARLASVRANEKVKVQGEDTSGDFSKQPAARYLEEEKPFSFDPQAWEKKLATFTSIFSTAEEDEGQAELTAETETRRFVNSEGSEIRMSQTLYRIVIQVSVKAADGMELPVYRTFAAFTPDALPSDGELSAAFNQVLSDARRLRNAPLADAYTGPAILSGRSSAVFFHEIFGHRIEAQRQKLEDEAQTFRKKVNELVLPPEFSVYSDPTAKTMGKLELVGYYPYDDEGVKAKRVTVVSQGVLKNFLTSRSPIENFPSSNGHGRRQQGHAVVARQSNLIVESSKTVSRAQLKQLLLAQIKQANKPYGLLFDDIEGGFAFTQRGLPNAFNVIPTMVYRVYPDGREELVRGVDLIGTPLIAFSKIVGADDEVGVFNGICGAESGWVPVSAVSPGILVAQIEVQRKQKSQSRPPLLPAPPRQQGK